MTWAMFLLVVGRVLATATLHADAFAAAARMRRRFVWVAGLTLTAIWPAVAITALRIGDVALSHGWGVGGAGEPRHLPMLNLRLTWHSLPARIEVALLAAWSLVSAALLLRLALFAHISRRWRRSLPIAVVDGVRVRLTKNVGPAVGGLIAMDVILPAWVRTLEPLERSLVLEHELSHREARDIYLLWFAALLVALVPWNLLLWWQASHLRRAVELDCDARVLEVLPHPVTYARMLVRIAHQPNERSWSRLGPALVGEATHLEQRIAAMSARQHASARTCAIHGVIVIAAIVVALAFRAPATTAGHRANSRVRARVHTSLMENVAGASTLFCV